MTYEEAKLKAFAVLLPHKGQLYTINERRMAYIDGNEVPGVIYGSLLIEVEATVSGRLFYTSSRANATYPEWPTSKRPTRRSHLGMPLSRFWFGKTQGAIKLL